MHVEKIVFTDDDPAIEGAAELASAILGPASLARESSSGEPDGVVRVGRAGTGPDIEVRAPSVAQDLSFFQLVPRLRDALSGVDVAWLVEGATRLARQRTIARPAPHADVLARVDEHLRDNNVCVLATGPSAGFRAIPIEYDWDGSTLAFLSEGGEKFARMALQPEVSLALADRYTGFATLRGTQVTGHARLLEPSSTRVTAMLARKGLTERIAALPFRMHAFQVEPTRIEHIDAELARRLGVDARQLA